MLVVRGIQSHAMTEATLLAIPKKARWRLEGWSAAHEGVFWVFVCLEATCTKDRVYR